MTEAEMKARTKSFALRVMRLVDALPATRSAEVLGRQLLRSGTSVGANYRAACRARSRADMYSKLGVVEEEADETGYWLELIEESDLMPREKISSLTKETDEIVRIIVASRLTMHAGGAPEAPAKIKNQKSKIKNQVELHA